MNQIKNLRKLAIFVLISAGLLTLAACGSKEATPYGNISDDVYMTVGNVTVTEKELYNQLRLQGASILATMIDEQVFADQLATVETMLAAGDEDLNTYLDETINSAIHSTSDEEQLDDLFTNYQSRFIRNIEVFADSLYLLDNTVSIDTVISSITNLSTTQDNGYSGYSSIPLLVERYGLRVAQRYYAQQILEDDVLDSEGDYYISDEDVLTYYKSNEQNRYDVEALVVRFINLNEANAALYQMSIKADSKGLWYSIPDIRILPGDPGYVDLTNETPQSGYKHVKNILDDLGLLGKLGVDYEDRAQISVSDFENYYKAYIISTTRTDGLSDEALTTAQVKAKFVAIYNVLNPASQVEITVDGAIVGVGGAEVQTTYTYDDLTAINTSLRSHLYTTLIPEATMEDPDDVADGKPYSSRVQTFGSSRYLVFKLDDESETDALVYDEETEDFLDTPEATAAKADVYTTIKEAKLSSTYISNKVNELYTDMSLNIYDYVVRTFYEQSYGYEGTTKDKAGNVLAEVGDFEVTVDDFYARLERSYGINLALDLASNRFLMNETDYVVTEEDMADYEQQFEDIISQFSADNFASSGYPASMGRQNFLLLAFGATSNAESINQLFVYPNLRDQYLKDKEAQYSNDTETIYTKLAELAELQYNNFKSITVSHLLVYFDENGDGTPDDPQEYLDTLSPAGQTQVLTGLTNLVQLLYTKVGDYKGMAAGLTGLATEFNNSGRIDRGSIIPPYDYQIELIWSQYRKLGFYLKFENISSAITNTSNFITGSSVLDEVFYNRAMSLFDTLATIEDDDAKFPYLDLYDAVVNDAALEQVKSAFGWHLILATSVAETTSAIYNEIEDEDGKYVNADETLNAYNSDSDTLTASQIEYYLTEQETDEGVVLPTVVQTAITNYLTPVLTRYEGTYMQRELIFKLLEDADFTVAANLVRFNTIRDINRRQLNEYLLSSTGFFDQNYSNLYGSWFDVLEG
ncbi:MAG: hypothetical protein K9L02_05890 [Acholeplasmataceae bacterium]|nr:hypothetical protein [Acholeplasmataceae bacterium]